VGKFSLWVVYFSDIYRKILGKIRNNWVFFAICLTVFVIYLLISVLKHLQFNSTGFDLVIFDQAVRGYSNFTEPASSFRGFTNLLGDHFHPILALLAPLYWVFDSPISLLVAQAALVVISAIPVYLFSKKRLGLIASNLITTAYLFSPLLIRLVYFDFHEIAFAIPLIAWSIYLIDIKRFKWFMFCVILLLLTKENLSITVVFLGLYLLLKREWVWGIATAGIGIIWFFLATKVLIPFFAGPNKGFNYWTYDSLGKDMPTAIVAIITEPHTFLAILANPFIKVVTFVKTFGTFLGLSFLSPIVILVIPTLLERFLSSNENYWQFNYHYGAILAPIIAMAAVDGISRLKRINFVSRYYSYITILLGIVFAAISLVIFLVTPMNFILKPSSYVFSNDTKAGHEIINQLPQGLHVCTTNRIAPHLGEHQLTLIGFYEQEVDVSECTHALLSSNLDQSSILERDVFNLRNSGFVISSQNESWTLYEMK